MNTLIKQIFVVLLLVVTAGSVLFCIFVGMMSMNGPMNHAAADHNTLATHLGYIKTLTSGVVTASLLLTPLLLTAVIALALLARSNLSVGLAPAWHTWKKYRAAAPDIQLTTRHWLSLLGRSPAS
jgi:hypothetical protein